MHFEQVLLLLAGWLVCRRRAATPHIRFLNKTANAFLEVE
jgi:CBS domain containing-hemolysin-like protein